MSSRRRQDDPVHWDPVCWNWRHNYCSRGEKCKWQHSEAIPYAGHWSGKSLEATWMQTRPQPPSRRAPATPPIAASICAPQALWSQQRSMPRAISTALHVEDQDRLADEYIRYVKDMVAQQANAESAVERLLTEECRNALKQDFDWDLPEEYSLLARFGSRGYGLALPSSDVDIVAQLPQARFASNRDVQDFLREVLPRLKVSKQSTSVEDAIVSKCTISFRCCELRVDFTAHIGSAAAGHGPSQLTNVVKAAISHFPDSAASLRSLAALTVDFVKRAKVCWDRKGGIDNQLKAIHWVLLAIAWWLRETESGTKDVFSSARVAFRSLLGFFANFCFEKEYVCMTPLTSYLAIPSTTGESESFFRPRCMQDEATAWLSCPLDERRNLASRLDAVGLTKLRAALLDGCKQLDEQPGLFWKDSKDRWFAYVERKYQERPPPREKARPFPPPLSIQDAVEGNVPVDREKALKYLRALVGLWETGIGMDVYVDNREINELGLEAQSQKWARRIVAQSTSVKEGQTNGLRVIMIGTACRWKIRSEKSRRNVIVWTPVDLPSARDGEENSLNDDEKEARAEAIAEAHSNRDYSDEGIVEGLEFRWIRPKGGERCD
eukprot:gnl/TRDRNA2_/TRDRNA2_150907_c0_seq2.p1 gnl/TRDRNA2_/TRDRNA2_150907_c0~~gnl/TRDRNA2_/TRDRNA2_150907_c0_seq2.p1  ORF type:complete len:608 (-),score=100.42 gnl/TRDRNA2_/TRDRNA2_150907_c0_seq2:12-1835(-)